MRGMGRERGSLEWRRNNSRGQGRSSAFDAASLICAITTMAGCADYGIDVRGIVVDRAERPVPIASLLVAARENNTRLDSCLRGDAAEAPLDRRTDDTGRFHVSQTLGGGEHHEVWIVVGKEGFSDYSEKVWEGAGGPDQEIALTIELSPE